MPNSHTIPPLKYSTNSFYSFSHGHHSLLQKNGKKRFWQIYFKWKRNSLFGEVSSHVMFYILLFFIFNQLYNDYHSLYDDVMTLYDNLMILYDDVIMLYNDVKWWCDDVQDMMTW